MVTVSCFKRVKEDADAGVLCRMTSLLNTV